jgi:ParB family transcriptional regulator, chromosome partitioning protein
MRRESMSNRIKAKRMSRTVIHGPGIPRMIPLSEIEPDPNNVRKHIDENDLAELAGSIMEQGVLHPILVRSVKPSKTSKTKFQIIAGERRYRAARLAGLKEILALISEMNEVEALGAQLENLQRKDLHPLDEADSLLRLKEVEKLEISDIAQRLAKTEQYVARRLSLTNLIEEAREDLRSGRISLAHALEICRLAGSYWLGKPLEASTLEIGSKFREREIWVKVAVDYPKLLLYRNHHIRPGSVAIASDQGLADATHAQLLADRD